MFSHFNRLPKFSTTDMFWYNLQMSSAYAELICNGFTVNALWFYLSTQRQMKLELWVLLDTTFHFIPCFSGVSITFFSSVAKENYWNLTFYCNNNFILIHQLRRNRQTFEDSEKIRVHSTSVTFLSHISWLTKKKNWRQVFHRKSEKLLWKICMSGRIN